MTRAPLAPSLRAHVVRLAAGLAIAAGYLDLARGGTVAAPVLLVVGYVVLVPAALLLE